MNVTPRAKQWFVKIIKYLAVAWAVYVLVINALFQIPLTQTVINKIRPCLLYTSDAADEHRDV